MHTQTPGEQSHEMSPLDEDRTQSVSSQEGGSAQLSGNDEAARRVAELERDLHALCHDLRSPLVALQGFARLLEEDHAEHLDANGRRFLSRVRQAGQRIEWRLRDFDVLAKVSEEPGSPEWISLRPEFEQLAAELKPALDAAGAELHWSDNAGRVYADRSRLAAVLQHLVGNALQFKSGTIGLEVSIETRLHEDDTEIIVSDSGPGIEADQIPRVLELFHGWGERQRAVDTTRESSGLGLALVKRIADAHGGRVSIESEVGVGTSVHVRFPHAEDG